MVKKNSFDWKESVVGRLCRRGLAAFVASGLAFYILSWLKTTDYVWSGIGVAAVAAIIMVADKGFRDRKK